MIARDVEGGCLVGAALLGADRGNWVDAEHDVAVDSAHVLGATRVDSVDAKSKMAADGAHVVGAKSKMAAVGVSVDGAMAVGAWVVDDLLPDFECAGMFFGGDFETGT